MSLPISRAALARRRCRAGRCRRSASRRRVTLPGQAIRPITASIDDALAGAGFADDAEDLARVDVRSSPSTARKRPARGRELDGEVADFEQRPSALQLRIERVAQAVAEQVEGEHGDAGWRGRGRSPSTRRAGNIAARRPAWCPIPASAAARPARGSPSAAASRMALEKPSVACTISGARQFGSTVIEHQPQRAGAGAARRRDIVARQFRQGGGARPGARSCGSVTIDDGDHGVEQARPEDRDDDDGQQQARETPAGRPSAA